MPAHRKEFITHSDLDVDTFPWDEVRRLACLGLRYHTDFAGQLKLPYNAIRNAYKLNVAFREAWDEAVGQSQSEAVVELLELLWDKARGGVTADGKPRESDRAAIIELLRRLDPESAAKLAAPVVEVKSDKAVILTGPRLDERLALYKNKALKVRQQAAIEIEMENEDGRTEE